MPSDPVYNSRFNAPAEAIAYAQANGQGQLTVAADGSTTNRFGEKMVYDSSATWHPHLGLRRLSLTRCRIQHQDYPLTPAVSMTPHRPLLTR